MFFKLSGENENHKKKWREISLCCQRNLFLSSVQKVTSNITLTYVSDFNNSNTQCLFSAELESKSKKIEDVG